jgi:hypothetical protein
VEKRKFLTLPGLEVRPLLRPARSQLLYRLRYRGSSTADRISRRNFSLSANIFGDFTYITLQIHETLKTIGAYTVVKKSPQNIITGVNAHIDQTSGWRQEEY